MSRSIWLWLETQEILGSNPDRDVCHRGSVYTVLQTLLGPRVCSALYETIHYKEPFKLFDNE